MPKEPEWQAGDLVWVRFEHNHATAPPDAGVFIKKDVDDRLPYYIVKLVDGMQVVVHHHELTRRFPSELHEAVWNATNGS